MSLYLSRIRVGKSPSVQALAPLLGASDAGRKCSADHSLLWSVFADGPERDRDFLWRAEAGGQYLALSARPPQQVDLFEPHEVRTFSPRLAPADRLEFALRANATRQKRGGKRVDVVMDALHAVPKDARGGERMGLAAREGAAWLGRQGERAGFRVLAASVEDYRVETVPDLRGRRAKPLRFGILDMTGQIEIVDPAAFVKQLGEGFGRARAFGCGLMLIRRAR